MGRTFLKILIAAVVLATACAIYNVAAGAMQRRRYPPPGSFYEVQGHRMHLYCTGAGSPTVVLEAGAGDQLLYWQTVQPQLARVTRVCSYDRAGLGWSDPTTGEHDAEAIAQQLHQLLVAAAVRPPFVLVGASAGGYYVREYTREFPNEVVGVAFLDASFPSQVDELPGQRQWYDAERPRRLRASRWQKLRTALGWERLLGRCHDDVPPGLEQLRAAYDAAMCRTSYVGADLPEWFEFEKSGHEAGRLTSLGDRPLVVISQDPNRDKKGWTQQAIAAQPVWAHEQAELATLSSRSWHIVARGSGHHIHQERPEVVIGEITQLVDYLRGGPAPHFGETSVR